MDVGGAAARRELQIPGGIEPKRRKGRAGARRSGAGAAAGPRSGCSCGAREIMSRGSSCSQTPSRAIPATRRVVLGDGVQLPPGDYSTTPGGTLFSTTPGGRRGLRAPRAGSGCGLWGGPTGQSGRDQESLIGRGDQALGVRCLGRGVKEVLRLTEVPTGSERGPASRCPPRVRPPEPGLQTAPFVSSFWERQLGALHPNRYRDCHMPRCAAPCGCWGQF